ncbi:MAG: MerR family transcriptional regulator [Deltaproteobacteria bacterium]|nr:MerR family transcriptional regulator [Deltaproteobacteria bacterium]
MDKESQLLTISEVSKSLNISKHTLRFWEKEFGGILISQKTQGGQRRYNYEHLVVIEGIKKLRDQGMSLSDIKRELHDTSKEERSNSSRIDLLAHRVAEVVKVEVYNFFKE